MRSHYIVETMGRDAARRFAQKAIIELLKVQKEKKKKRIILIYTGMSGVSVATALAHYLPNEPGMIYVRKPNEKSHGCSVEEYYDEGRYGERPDFNEHLLVFVDDFIDKGFTLERCLKKIAEWTKQPTDETILCLCSPNRLGERSYGVFTLGSIEYPYIIP